MQGAFDSEVLHSAQDDTRKRAYYVRDQLPSGGLFAGMTWRIAPSAFTLHASLITELESLGPKLLAFYRACNTLYRHSVAGKQPKWIADYLDAGKPSELIALSRSDRFRSAVARVIRPDVILSDDGFFISELDSVPGGIGLTGWLGKTYAELGDEIVGGAHGMMEGFAEAMRLGRGAEAAPTFVVVVSDEAATYRPEMEWLGAQIGFQVMKPEEVDKRDACPTVYRFFELFDLANVPNAWAMMSGDVTPPPKPQLEEKMLMAFLWQPQLEAFWREHLGAETLAYLRRVFPRTWIVDATPLPPHAVIPELDITDWREMARFSQKQRELVLKISGFHESAWGARSVSVGHDLSAGEWAAAIERAVASWPEHPFVLQRFGKSRLVETEWFDFEANEARTFAGRVRLCPYYFVIGDTTKLGGVLATVCSSNKKVLHGMSDAVMAPCRLQSPGTSV